MNVCKNNIDKFCYVCGHYLISKRKKGYFRAGLKSAYEDYFNQTVIFGVPWVPNTICKTCFNYLLEWQRCTRKLIPFGAPMIWIYPVEHNSLNVKKMFGSTKKSLKNVEYISVLIAQILLPHSENIPPVHKSPDIFSITSFEDNHTAAKQNICQPDQPQDIPVKILQYKIKYIAAKLELRQRKSEELASFLNEVSLLTPDTQTIAKLYYKHFLN